MDRICRRVKANMESPTLGYMFLEVKGEGAIVFSYKGSLSLRGGQRGVGKRTQEYSSAGKGLKLTIDIQPISRKD